MQPLGKEHFNSLKKGCYIRPFEGNLEADVAPGENEFDTLGLKQWVYCLDTINCSTMVSIVLAIPSSKLAAPYGVQCFQTASCGPSDKTYRPDSLILFCAYSL